MVTILERQAVHIPDRESRKANIIIYNLPESKQDTAVNNIVEDNERVEDMLCQGINVDRVKLTKLIGLGGRGKNQNVKPRLIMATLDQPARRRDILAAAKSLRHTDKWSNVYICVYITRFSASRKRKREELKMR